MSENKLCLNQLRSLLLTRLGVTATYGWFSDL